MGKILNIGIISPNTYSVGGYDEDSPQRKLIKQSISSILDKYSNQDIICITGLSMGCEQDFAKICLEKNINYITYLPFLNQEKYWNAPNEEYKELLNQSYDTEIISRGEYSPRKILKKNRVIANNCDIIIYIWNNLKNKCSVLSKIINNKTVYIIKV